jgi:hypothetical protein
MLMGEICFWESIFSQKLRAEKYSAAHEDLNTSDDNVRLTDSFSISTEPGNMCMKI